MEQSLEHSLAKSLVPAGVELSAERLYGELWVSLASLLRSYTAAHGLNRQHQATVELSEEAIMVRAGNRWLALDRAQETINWIREDQSSGVMTFTEDGRLRETSGAEEEMDMQAEAWARGLML